MEKIYLQHCLIKIVQHCHNGDKATISFLWLILHSPGFRKLVKGLKSLYIYVIKKHAKKKDKNPNMFSLILANGTVVICVVNFLFPYLFFSSSPNLLIGNNRNNFIKFRLQSLFWFSLYETVDNIIYMWKTRIYLFSKANH